MDFLKVTFALSGIETYIFIPPLVAFSISFFTSMGGISGAFLLLPFQMSVLGFTSPSVTATNFLYNVTGTPAGVYRYAKEIWTQTVTENETACSLSDKVEKASIGISDSRFVFKGINHSFSTGILLMLAMSVGIVGGVYGIGGGSIIAPFLITFFSI